jgi:hypothetical protein
MSRPETRLPAPLGGDEGCSSAIMSDRASRPYRTIARSAYGEDPPDDPASISRMNRSPIHADCLDLDGDAQILLTAPFFPSTDPLDYRSPCRIPVGGVLDGGGRLIQSDRSMDPLLRGSLTYGNPHIDLVTQFAGTEPFNAELAAAIDGMPGLSLRLAVTGMLFPDGYGSVAARIEVPGGWTADRRDCFLERFGPRGREFLADKLRAALLPALAELAETCCKEASDETLLPYFNLTYVAVTSHPRPGRATLPDNLRLLVYPRSPAPITSDSPWSDEFFYAGYAYSLLASAAPQRTLDQLELLLLHLDVLYARMDRSATAADRSIRERSGDEDVDWLVGLELRLRADYQALVRPTYSFDYHVLKLRDGLLSAWETGKTRARTETLLLMARQAVERRLAQEQARRVSRVNVVVTILTVLTVFASADAAVDLWARLFG